MAFGYNQQFHDSYKKHKGKSWDNSVDWGNALSNAVNAAIGSSAQTIFPGGGLGAGMAQNAGRGVSDMLGEGEPSGNLFGPLRGFLDRTNALLDFSSYGPNNPGLVQAEADFAASQSPATAGRKWGGRIPMPASPGGIGDFMGDPAVIAAVNAAIASANRPIKGQIREERRDLKGRVGMHKTLGADFKQQANMEKRRVAQQAAQRKKAHAQEVQAAAGEYEQRHADASGGVQTDEVTQQRMRDEGLTQEQRLRDLMRADAEFSAKGSDSMQDVIGSYASSTDASTRQAIERDQDASDRAVRGYQGEISANRQRRPEMMLQLAQQFQQAAQQQFQNQMAIREQRVADQNNVKAASAARRESQAKAMEPGFGYWDSLFKPREAGSTTTTDPNTGDKTTAKAYSTMFGAQDPDSVFNQLVYRYGFPPQVAASMIKSQKPDWQPRG